MLFVAGMYMLSVPGTYLFRLMMVLLEVVGGLRPLVFVGRSLFIYLFYLLNRQYFDSRLLPPSLLSLLSFLIVFGDYLVLFFCEVRVVCV